MNGLVPKDVNWLDKGKSNSSKGKGGKQEQSKGKGKVRSNTVLHKDGTSST